MKLRDIENVNKPIIYIAFSLLLASIIFGIYNDYLWLAAGAVGLFFIFVYKSTNMIFTCIVVIIFILGLINNFRYYNINNNENFNGMVTIIEEKSYYKIGEVNERRFYIEGELRGGKLGDNIYFHGELSKNIDFEKGILGTINIDKVYSNKKTYRSYLYDTRERIYNKFKENLGQRKAALISSLAFGYSDYLDVDDKEDMKSLGVIHAISVSGLHVALIFLILQKVCKSHVLAIGGTCIYVLLTGASYSSVRALIMIILLNMAGLNKRNYNPLAALSFALGAIILFEPYAVFQLGFMLSFLAALGIILFSRKLNNKLYKLPAYIRKTLSVSLAAQVFVVPVMLTSFNQCSFTFIIGNLLLMPVLNILIVLGNISFFVLPVEVAFDFLSYVLLKIINVLDKLLEVLYDIGNSVYTTNSIMVLVYVSILVSIYLSSKGKKGIVSVPLSAIIAVCIYFYSPVFRVDYLNEGALLLSYKGDRKIIASKRNIDMGKMKKETLAKEGFRTVNKIRINNGIVINSKNKNFILKVKDKEYLLVMNKKNEPEGNYDIINFMDKKHKGLFIFNDEAYIY